MNRSQIFTAAHAAAHNVCARSRTQARVLASFADMAAGKLAAERLVAAQGAAGLTKRIAFVGSAENALITAEAKLAAYQPVAYRAAFAAALRAEYAATRKADAAREVAAVEARLVAEGGRMTSRQEDYLRVLGYRGPSLSKRAASVEIDRIKGAGVTLTTLTAADVDDFTGPSWTW